VHRFGSWLLRTVPWLGLGLIVDGLEHADGTTAVAAESYVDEVLLDRRAPRRVLRADRRVGLVVCRQRRRRRRAPTRRCAAARAAAS
jgi:chorismate-pyruvate lyase